MIPHDVRTALELEELIAQKVECADLNDDDIIDLSSDIENQPPAPTAKLTVPPHPRPKTEDGHRIFKRSSERKGSKRYL